MSITSMYQFVCFYVSVAVCVYMWYEDTWNESCWGDLWS